jgi:hypothetical protein
MTTHYPSDTYPRSRESTLADEQRYVVQSILGHALLLGVVADLLLREGAGLAFPIWIALVAVAATALAWGADQDVSTEAAAWLVTAVCCSMGLAWRDSEQLQALNLLATVGALGMAAIALSNEDGALFAMRFRDTVWAGAALIRSVFAGFIPLVASALFASAPRERLSGRLWPALRAGLIAAVVIAVFGSLLRGADPIFASFVTLPEFDVGVAVSHLFVIGFFTWVVSGWARGALVNRVTESRAPSGVPFGLSQLDVTAALGTLIVLFVTYLVAQLGWFFGGEQFLQTRTGLTAAEYARRGFFEMVWVAALVIPLLMGTRAALHPGHALERRHSALGLALVVLLCAMIASAASRMRLYVHYYGLTSDRLYTLVFMAWLTVVLAWLALTVLRGRGRYFVAGAVISGAITLVALNVMAPDVIVARFNVNRAVHPSGDNQAPLDLRHLAFLSGDAVDVAIRATLAPTEAVDGSVARQESDQQRCAASRELLRHWGPASSIAERQRSARSWRFWNAGEWAALRAVGKNAATLLQVQHATCLHVPKNHRY